MKYLHEQGEKYKDHEYATGINRAIGRKIYDLLPDDAKNELEQMILKPRMEVRLFQRNFMGK